MQSAWGKMQTAMKRDDELAQKYQDRCGKKYWVVGGTIAKNVAGRGNLTWTITIVWCGDYVVGGRGDLTWTINIVSELCFVGRGSLTWTTTIVWCGG